MGDSISDYWNYGMDLYKKAVNVGICVAVASVAGLTRFSYFTRSHCSRS